MKTILLICLLLISTYINASEDKTYINTSSELKEWCKFTSSKYFIAKDITPYNWTASWWNEGNFIYIKGSWRIKTKNISVKCSIRKGAEEKYALMIIENSKAQTNSSSGTGNP